jgi:predicted metal-dependent hydrolase
MMMQHNRHRTQNEANQPMDERASSICALGRLTAVVAPGAVEMPQYTIAKRQKLAA